MLRIISRFFLFGTFCALVLISLHAFAQQTITTTTTAAPTTAVVVERPAMIITEVPAPKEVVTVPVGYVNCFTVKAGWYQDVWVADHQVCQYANDPSGTVWVEGYWACSKYSQAEGKCTNWDWKAAHWEKTLVVY